MSKLAPMSPRHETTAQRNARLVRQAARNRGRRRRGDTGNDASGRAQETIEGYNTRLIRQRERNHSRRTRSMQLLDTECKESVESHERRLELQRRYATNRRRTAESEPSTASETTEERHSRVRSQQEYNQLRRANSTFVDRMNDGSERLVVPETSQEREQRLARQRVQDRRRRKAQRGECDSVELKPVEQDVKARIEQELLRSIGPQGLGECVCAVCDRLVLVSQRTRINLDDAKFLDTLRRTISIDLSLPGDLIAHYNCELIDARLGGLALSAKGVIASAKAMNVCAECNAYLQKKDPMIPKFSIANGFYIGALPENLFEATWIETVMTQLVTVVAQTRVMRGGRHRAIRSHCMVFDATPGPAATLLPRRIDREGIYSVVLAGPFTDKQTERIRKLHLVRGSMVASILQFMKANNPFYAGVSIDESAVAALTESDVMESLFVREECGSLADAVDREQESIGGQNDALSLDESEECEVIERNILLEDILPDGSCLQRVTDLNANEARSQPRLRLHHSSMFATGDDILARMFAHLFPFGRGHPADARRTPVSKRDCIKYYAMLSSRRFAQDPTFLMAAFAQISLEKMYTLTSIKCRRNPTVFAGYDNITPDALETALLSNERRQRGQSPIAPPDPVAAAYLRSVEIGSAAVWGSSAERRQCRQEAFGYQLRFGQPSLFVTLTPNTDNSFSMAHYAGSLSVESLFDYLEARIPTRAEMKKAAMDDDCASARLNMRTVDAFIEHVLGIDPKDKSPKEGGGLFGKTRAYYGMVETQGRGTLHVHFIIWLSGFPANASEFEAKVASEGDMFKALLCDYADSIVQTTLPLAIERIRCVGCGETGPRMGLGIPRSGRRQPKKKSVRTQKEPLLLECASCSLQSSAQHVLRQMLIQTRPPHWPPELSPLASIELARRAAAEAGVRGTIASALNRVRDRESTLSALGESPEDNELAALQQLADRVQLTYVHPEDEARKHDQIARQILMYPPSQDTTRMKQLYQDFELTSLVIDLNMHWWAHTGSCFKTSRATNSDSQCRYRFPRERANATTLTDNGIALKRTPGHEYVNGFNPIIMRAFKCNHDIQVLCGGKEAINRIYYCCKYVTKAQRQIDTTSAVALASFQRRRMREVDEMSTSSVHDIQRRRVTSMIYTFTNKQEIAGPLAAFYLFRGSCAYTSHYSVNIPLWDILKQLESTSDYTCTLIPVENAETQRTSYKSASALDDYMNRPEATENLSLYEFEMKCYRRLRAQTASLAHLFKRSHPLYASHCVAFRRRDAVPVIKGARLTPVADEMTEGAREESAKKMLILFKPFRSLDDLTRSDSPQSWIKAYDLWLPTRSAFVATIMANIEDDYSARKGEDDPVIDEGDRDTSDSDASSGAMSDFYDYETGDHPDEFSLPDDSQVIEDNIEKLLDGSVSRDTSSSKGTSMDSFETHPLLRAVATKSVEVSRGQSTGDDCLSVEFLRAWVSDCSTDTTNEIERVNSELHTREDCMPTRMEEILDLQAGSDLDWTRNWTRDGGVAGLRAYCGIVDVSKAFTLNEMQHWALTIIAHSLLQRWRRSVISTGCMLLSDDELRQQQLLLFLSGEGGIGKSRVIHAVQEFCRQWERQNALVLTAMTGKAATIIGGRTLASFESTLRSSTAYLLLQDVDCLIVDEISMMSKKDLLRLDRLLRKAKRLPKVEFGGLNIVLVGDFFQLPPVGADPLFLSPHEDAPPSIYDAGFLLWRRFQKVVILTETMRFRDDPEWGEGCSRARYGDWTAAFVQMINARHIDLLAAESEVTAPSETVFVAPDNTTRMHINRRFIAEASAILATSELPVRVFANFKGALNRYNAADIAKIMRMPDTKFGRLSPYLDLIRGMPIQITQNIRTKKGVANGTNGYLHSIRFPPSTTFTPATDSVTGTAILIPSKRPLYALVRLKRGGNARPIQDGLHPDLFPVFPDSVAYMKSSITLTTSSSGETRTLSMKIQQFPFVCAVGATVYKVQGDSLQSLTVVDWKAKGRAINQPQQPYLMVSRVVRRDGLIVVNPFTPALAAWARPPKAAIDEDDRLKELAIQTVNEFRQSVSKSSCT